MSLQRKATFRLQEGCLCGIMSFAKNHSPPFIVFHCWVKEGHTIGEVTVGRYIPDDDTLEGRL